MKLPKSGAADSTDTELNAGEATRSFTVLGEIVVTLSGEFDSCIVTLQHAPKRNAAFEDFIVYDGAGAKSTLTFDGPGHVGLKALEGDFRLLCDSNGSPEINIFLSGPARLNA